MTFTVARVLLLWFAIFRDRFSSHFSFSFEWAYTVWISNIFIKNPFFPDDEFGEKTVSILLDGEESEMIFIDHPSAEMSVSIDTITAQWSQPISMLRFRNSHILICAYYCAHESYIFIEQVENSLSTYEPHGCVVVYSVVQRSSFRQAEEIVNYLWRENITRDKAVILVGNKADLARSRLIPTAEGKALAKSRDAKFIETSSGIQHNVDELLVGILKQVSSPANYY